jgi:hypothetical protein
MEETIVEIIISEAQNDEYLQQREAHAAVARAKIEWRTATDGVRERLHYGATDRATRFPQYELPRRANAKEAPAS